MFPPGVNGRTRYTDRSVTVRPDVKPAQAAKTLAHEARTHPVGTRGFGCRLWPPGFGHRGVAEVEAESVAYLGRGRQASTPPTTACRMSLIGRAATQSWFARRQTGRSRRPRECWGIWAGVSRKTSGRNDARSGLRTRLVRRSASESRNPSNSLGRSPGSGLWLGAERCRGEIQQPQGLARSPAHHKPCASGPTAGALDEGGRRRS